MKSLNSNITLITSGQVGIGFKITTLIKGDELRESSIVYLLSEVAGR